MENEYSNKRLIESPVPIIPGVCFFFWVGMKYGRNPSLHMSEYKWVLLSCGIHISTSATSEEECSLQDGEVCVKKNSQMYCKSNIRIHHPTCQHCDWL